MGKKVKIYNNRATHICFVCEKKIHPTARKYMVALDGYHHPVNLWIHWRCYDRARIEEILKDDEKRPRFIKDSV